MREVNELASTTPASQFRAKAQGLMIDAANMSLHQLVDEFQRLEDVMEKNTIVSDDSDFPKLNEDGEVARRAQKMVNAAARARFGIFFESYDRSNTANNSW